MRDTKPKLDFVLKEKEREKDRQMRVGVMEKQVSWKKLDGPDINIDKVHIRGVFNRIE